MCNYRDYHSTTGASSSGTSASSQSAGGCKVIAQEAARPFWLTTHRPPTSPKRVYGTGTSSTGARSSAAITSATTSICRAYSAPISTPARASRWLPARSRPTHRPPRTGRIGARAYRQQRLVRAAGIRSKAADADPSDPSAPLDAFTAQLVRAADTFIVIARYTPRRRDRAGAHRDRGLPLVHRLGPRHDDLAARPVARPPGARARRTTSCAPSPTSPARACCPTTSPTRRGAPQYNTADATLWMFAAIER